MKILLIEPFFTGSHKQWAEGLGANSSHQITLMTLPGYHWKWRMHGAAVTLAQQFNNIPNKEFDLVLVSDMLDLAVFKALTAKFTATIPFAIYFHENQLTYPWSKSDMDVVLKRDNHYAFINYTSALCADVIFFNSAYHRDSFLHELPRFLDAFPDFQNKETVDNITKKSRVLHLAMDLQRFNKSLPEKLEKYPRCLVLWNHRWEYDKNPEFFFDALITLHERGIDFRLAVLGEHFPQYPTIFDKAKATLNEKIVHWGYAANEQEYAEWLWKADLLPVTANQDFFGGSVVEAMYCNTVPLLPKRLAYPEHIPEQFQHTFFYHEDEFLVKLQKRIMDVKYLRAMNTQQWAEKYDWSNQIEVYDEAMRQIILKAV